VSRLEEEKKPFNHTGHKELWQWLSEDPNRKKEDWPGFNSDQQVFNHCFACDYIVKNDLGCESNCPLIWPDNKRCYDINCDLYSRWQLKRESKIAQQIRDLPVREGVKCI
jgi:hypothetical protein